MQTMTSFLPGTSRLAPVVLFVYARPDHTRETLGALQRNTLAVDTDLIIYSDAAQNSQAEVKVREVRELVRDISGFKSVRVIERSANWGLAGNIIDGVSQVCGQYGRVIVLEDDIVTSPTFLEFMNAALERYRHEPRVWHIGAWNYPVFDSARNAPDALLWRLMNCWAWATWADRWAYFRKEPRRLITEWDQEKIRAFNLDGAYDFWRQVRQNDAGEISTWAIFWYATIFENGGLCLNATKSYVRNIGLDGSGQNCGMDEKNQDIHDEAPATWPEAMQEDAESIQKLRRYLLPKKASIPIRIIRRLKRMATRLGEGPANN
ncbi:glycosyltransferase [Ferrovibrio xuzhouensis]|uniref:Glycosyltransferase n=1 Tax=Ferrovibrio xuzhouensis TaxID=1576914 RepID=A0ABV7VLD0_9PROT